MNKKVRKMLCLLVLCMFMVLGVRLDTQAAGGLSISANASAVSKGNTFTVTIKSASNYFVSNITMEVSGGTVVSGLGATSLDKGESTTAKIKLTGSACTVSVKGIGANYDTETEQSASASVTVKEKVVVVDTRSKDNTLSTLTVSTGTLTPAFSSSQTTYSVDVDGTTEKITLQAGANHSKAKVSGTGEKTLVPGQNHFVIVCTAENGSKKEYTITVRVDDTPVVHTEYGDEKLGVVRNQTDIGIPATFEQTNIDLAGQEVPAYRSNQFNLTLVYLENASGNRNFYIYEEEKGVTSIFRPVSIMGRNVIVYDLTEEEQVRENMVYSEVTIDGVTLYGWTYENPDFANYIHIMVMNESGEKVVYQYEKTENSLQLYQEYVPIKETVEEDEEKENLFSWKEIVSKPYMPYVFVGVIVLCIVLIITIIILVATRKPKCPARKRKHQKKLEKQRRKEEKNMK